MGQRGRPPVQPLGYVNFSYATFKRRENGSLFPETSAIAIANAMFNWHAPM